jgi:hypothetical protein
LAVIEPHDLQRLSDIARADLESYVAGDPGLRSGFPARILCVVLCQGAACHFLDKITGVKDMDVVTFFAGDEAKDFPAIRLTRHDFGPSKFGRNPDDEGYTGRRVDVMGRSIAHTVGASPVESVRHYLRRRLTNSASHWAKEAMVIIDPIEDRGQVIWPEVSQPAC